MYYTKKLISTVSILLTLSTATFANHVTVTFINKVSAFSQNLSTHPTNALLMAHHQPTQQSAASFNISNKKIIMKYTGSAELLTPGATYYAQGPDGKWNYYNLTCLNASGFPTTIDTRKNGRATITFKQLKTVPTYELTCTCVGRNACGTTARLK